jgi:hypothetical protein
MLASSGLGTLAVVILPVLALGYSEKPADPENYSAYSREGLSFNLPGDWSVKTDSAYEDGRRHLFIQAPGAGHMHISERPLSRLTFEEYGERFLQRFFEVTEPHAVGRFSATKDAPTKRIVQRVAGQDREGLEFFFSFTDARGQVAYRMWLFTLSPRGVMTHDVVAMSTVKDWGLFYPGFRQVFTSLSIGYQPESAGKPAESRPSRGGSVTRPSPLDRLLHHGHVLKCGPRSWRTKLHSDLRHEAASR